MWSWLTAAATWASRRKRLRAVGRLASCGASTLMATTRCKDGSIAWRTTPMPPQAMTDSTS
jgi:hypothetical protein